MKKIIDIPNEILQELKILAVKSNKDLKNFIQDELKKLVQNSQGNRVLPCVRSSAFNPHIWETSPAVGLTLKEIIAEINKLHEKIYELETKLERRTS